MKEKLNHQTSSKRQLNTTTTTHPLKATNYTKKKYEKIKQHSNTFIVTNVTLCCCFVLKTFLRKSREKN